MFASNKEVAAEGYKKSKEQLTSCNATGNHKLRLTLLTLILHIIKTKEIMDDFKYL